jgi:mono/diheme cytochrome c family protein
LDKAGRLLEFTAACSPLFYRGTALPESYYGNVFVCEPSGNLIKRNVVKDKGLLLTAYDPTPGKEFLASTDERFRPVFLATGPDGALYVADMYRGLVQHGLYVTPYLREQTLQRKLVKPIHCGRIWRIVPSDWKPARHPQLSKASLGELVAALSHPDGWHRDVAQRLLVERGDKTAQTLLEELVISGNHDLGRFHALWTLDGLHLSNPELLFKLLNDKSALVRSAAVRLLEPPAKINQDIQMKLGRELLRLWQTAPIEQILQISLTSYVLDPDALHPLLTGIADRYDTSALIRDGIMSSLENREFAFLKSLWKSPDWQTRNASKEIFLEMLTSAIVKKRQPDELGLLLAMLDRDKNVFGWKEKAVLTGIAIQGKNKMKPIRLKTVPNLLMKIDSTNDQLNTLATMFEWPGHVADTTRITRTNLLNENDQRQFVAGRQLYLTTCAGCHGSDGAGLNRFAPPLKGSEWVLGDAKRLALILLHGMEGPLQVDGKTYDAPEILPVMPSHSTMDDASIASILTYIRNEWGNAAAPVSRRTVGMTRVTSQGRVMPWTAAELDKHMAEKKAVDGK